MGTKKRAILLIGLTGIFLLAAVACQSGGLSEQALQETAAEAVFLDLVDTAVFETTVVDRLTAWAPTATLTHTPSPTVTLTPLPSLTPTITETVYKNPWVLQDSCVAEDPSACIGYSVQNTDASSWIQVTLTHQATGEEGTFSIAPKSTGTITLVPGKYKAVYFSTCGGTSTQVITKIWGLDARIDALYCSTGLHELRFR